jgi:hypothetical protein
MEKKLKLKDLYLNKQESKAVEMAKKTRLPTRRKNETNSSWFKRKMPYTADRIFEAIGPFRYKNFNSFLNSLK